MGALSKVEIDGSTVSPVRSARTATSEGKELGEARVELQDSSANRGFDPDDSLTITWDSGDTWTGDIVGRPSESGGVLTYRAFGSTLSLKHKRVYRLFYQTESSEAVKSLATDKAEQLDRRQVHGGDTPGDWTSVAPVAEAYGGGRAGLYDFGTDLLFVGCRQGHTSELRATFDSVTTDHIKDGIYELETRIISPFVAEWTLVIELKTPGGTSYRWEPELRDGAATYTLRAEDATADDSGLSDGALRYRFIPQGIVGQSTGFLLDNAATIPFRTSADGNSLSAAEVESTGRTISRRFDGTAFDAIADLATEDQAAVWTATDTLYYQPGTTQTDTAASITDGLTPVVSVAADRDFESVRNEALVTGGDGVESLHRNQQSINRYGRKRPRNESDPQITRKAEADARAKGILADQAFADASISFDIADISFAGLTAGQRVDVTWPDENLDGTHDIEGVAARSNGIVTVTISATT